jgi:hypothetical protein
MEKDPSQLTDKQLKDQLITSDYGGKEYKQKCLTELLNRTESQVLNSLKES